MPRLILAFVVLAGLSACSINRTTATPAEVSAAAFVNPAPPFVAVLTMMNSKSDFGEHSALVINGSQMVIYDPAGSFQEERVGLVRAEDVIYGVRPEIVDYYNSYHARNGYYVRMQRLDITAEEAEVLIAKAEARGAVPQLVCANATSDILNDLPRFSSINNTYFPGAVMRRFGRIEGVETTDIIEDDIGQNYR
ncbi:hypothetical protein [Abyssibius alkaniclasticus]|uniref:hypothetical protein n=1 Tax=Abyssibius alkaniclasticus TaxID=2881234 RepID=UPI00405A04E6